MQKWANSGAGPIQVKRFNHAWGKINWENNTFVELTGIVGVAERHSVCSMLGGRDTRADVTKAQESIGERFGWTVTKENVNDITKALAEALILLEQNRPVHDNRTTPDAEAERRAESARLTAESKARGDQAAAAFIRHYGSGEKVTVQPGQVAVVAQICFDNSDSMTDYFDRHASLSQAFVLAIVPKQAETERLARRGAEVSPLLSAIDFEWHTEKYSMGHGNYLESKGAFELPTELQGLRHRYGSDGEVTHAHWEITFQSAYRVPMTLDAIAGYGKTDNDPSKAQATPLSVTDVTISENTEKDGIEIRFPSKPAAAVLESLKTNGWRWSRFSSCWYTRRTESARQFAAALSRQAEPVDFTNTHDWNEAEGRCLNCGAENCSKVCPDSKTGEQSPAASPAPVSSLAVRFRAWADALQPKIDHAGRPMTQNPTPKRNREYQSRMHDCRNFERLQKALQALADAHETGTLPPELARLTKRDEIAAMVKKYIDTSKGGYYSVIEADDFHDTTPAARLLQSLIEGSSEQQAERERVRKIEALTAEIALSTIPGYFPTPAPVVKLMLDRAQLGPGLTILEPSAGSGNIADAVRAKLPNAEIYCFELNPRLAQILKLKGHHVDGDDFMVDEAIARIFDRVIMNPPFEKQADIDHVRKAHRLLKPGGLLISIMAPGFEFRQDRKSTEFRTWLDEMGGTWEDLPMESFKASGTGMRTKLVTIPAATGYLPAPSTTDTESVVLSCG